VHLADKVDKQQSNEDNVPCEPAVEQESYSSIEQRKYTKYLLLLQDGTFDIKAHSRVLCSVLADTSWVFMN